MLDPRETLGNLICGAYVRITFEIVLSGDMQKLCELIYVNMPEKVDMNAHDR